MNSTNRIIMCLRGDYKAIKIIKSKKELLEKQGIIIINDYINSETSVIISPLKNTPEYDVYYKNIEHLKNVIYEEDPEVALFKAIVYPKSKFDHVIVGIDPGISCGYVILGDGLIIGEGKVSCNTIGNTIKKELEKIPHINKEVILGSGEGWITAGNSLIKNGLSYKIVREDDVAKNMPKTPIFKIFKDKDVRSAMVIALRGSRNWMDH
ncbi:hypothetical protein Calag_0756 [Caldisphaera lagunensis DSM 15908]|uniref:Uncharacterized protein n=1 Tax=Caldisphaera lagunensis (strain DSM 15908 / JCM 11604 / ANMR 0165 / IC-154) TaxID=1056495 RepID=L0ABS8_CALLD|nr:hypothetical protein [Caldisphaera lagunensis]AFZ70500.1 hypothetical protein Calag_0756 [Caldisphaera lagunensis DSM 15908]